MYLIKFSMKGLISKIVYATQSPEAKQTAIALCKINVNSH